MNASFSKVERMERVAARLNQERAAIGIGFLYRKNQIVGFVPCAKAEVYLAATHAPGEYRPDALRTPDLLDINTMTPTSLIHVRAALTICECHAGLTAHELLDYEFGK